MSEYKKPLPFVTEETRPFWEGCQRHELVLPYCTACRAFYYYPRPFCPQCFSWDIEWRRTSGRGRLYTYAIQYRPQAPGFDAELPYVTAIVELDEGPRMMTNLVGVDPDPDKIRCDMPVEVTFDDVTDAITLPKFRPAGAPAK
jgi:uncharacterized OB-fold protein